MYSRPTYTVLGALLTTLVSIPTAAPAQTERQILIDFYEATNGDAWYRNSGWLGEEDHCTWAGIACFEGKVSEIRLPRNNISGPLEESLFQLEALHDLNLSGNNIQGDLPSAVINDLPQFDVALPDNAIFIDLSGNLLSGRLPTFTRQQGPGERVHIKLSDNDLAGPVPASWVNMKLATLDLSDNKIDTGLAHTWKSLPTARAILMAGAGLSGTFPEDPQRFQGDDELTAILERLDFSRNRLQGELPAWLANLTLQTLSLHHNDLSGEIPVAVDAMAREGLITLDLASNQFSGPIPESLEEVPFERVDEISGARRPSPGLNLCWNNLDEPDQEMHDFIEARHHANSYRDCQQARANITPVFSGSRYDPERNGEGYVQHLLDNGQVLLFWFTYPVDNAGENVKGEQGWFLSVTSPLENSLWLEQMLQPTGRFAEGSDGFETPTFRLSVDALDTDNQQVSYSRDYIAHRSLGGVPIYGLMSKRHQQTTLTRLAGTTCDNQQPHQWVSGAWYDPSRSGEGFMIDVTENGRVVVYWFTYEPNDFEHQAWMIGTGDFVDGQVVVEEMIQPTGTLFGTDFDPEEIQHVDWGSLTMEFTDQDSGQVSYESNLEEYGSGSYPIERLAQPMLADCD